MAYRLLPSVLALRRDRRRWARRGGADPERYRRNARRALAAFVALGPVYIKLGQWLSSRADILPQPYLEELSKLQDDVPPAPFEQARRVIDRELGGTGAFDSLDTEAISGASLGQVYRAVAGGRQVVVKVRRPGIEGEVRADLAVLRRVLPLALRFVDPNLGYSARAMLAQFVETIHEEMDYAMEASNLRAIRRNLRGHPGVIVPAVHDGLSSGGVITMDYVPGTKVTDVAALDALGIDRERLVADVHRVFFTMLLRHAVFHADPHPGNVAVSDDGRIILYDYGMVGRLDGETRVRLVRLYLALVERDPARAVRAMGELGMLAPGADVPVIERAIGLSVRALHGRRPDEMEVRGLMEVANRTMSRFPFLLPKNLALYMRMASIIEGIYKAHDVELRFVRVLRDVMEGEGLVREAYAAEARSYLGRLARAADAAVGLAPELGQMLADYRAGRAPGGRRRAGLLPASVMSGAVFAGSAVLYASGEALGIAGMVCALAAVPALAAFRR